MKKKLMTIVLCLLMIQVTSITAQAADDIKVFVDGQRITFDQPPILVNNRVLVPMRAIFEALGYEVDWDSHLQMASADKRSELVSLNATAQLKTKTLYVREVEYAPEDVNKTNPIRRVTFIIGFGPDSPIQITNGRTLLPTRAVAEALGCKVDWDGVTRSVTIDTVGAQIKQPEGWEDALIKHYETYYPNQVADAKAIKENQLAGTMNYDRRGVVTATPNPQPTQTPPSADTTPIRPKNIILHDPQPEMMSPPTEGTFLAKVLKDPALGAYIDGDTKKGVLLSNFREDYMTHNAIGQCTWYATGRLAEVTGVNLYALPTRSLYEAAEVAKNSNGLLHHRTSATDISVRSVAVFMAMLCLWNILREIVPETRPMFTLQKPIAVMTVYTAQR